MILESLHVWLMTYESLQFWLENTCSLMTILAIYLMGNKSIWGPGFGTLSGVPWLWLIWVTGMWGLLPSTLIITSIHARNWWKWYRDAYGEAKYHWRRMQ